MAVLLVTYLPCSVERARAKAETETLIPEQWHYAAPGLSLSWVLQHSLPVLVVAVAIVMLMIAVAVPPVFVVALVSVAMPMAVLVMMAIAVTVTTTMMVVPVVHLRNRAFDRALLRRNRCCTGWHAGRAEDGSA